jgi:hypothetical protein
MPWCVSFEDADVAVEGRSSEISRRLASEESTVATTRVVIELDARVT